MSLLSTAGLLNISSKTYDDYVLNLNPEGFWKLNGDATDLSSNSRHGTIVGTVNWSATPLTRGNDRCFESTFNGTNISGYITLPALPSYNKFTLISFLKSPRIATDGSLYYFGKNNQNVFYTINKFAAAYFNWNAAPGPHFSSSQLFLDPDAVYMIVYVYDQTIPINEGRLKLYLNGNFQETFTNAFSVIDVGNVSNCIGSIGTNTSEQFSGNIQNVSMFNYALNENDIAELYKLSII